MYAPTMVELFWERPFDLQSHEYLLCGSWLKRGLRTGAWLKCYSTSLATAGPWVQSFPQKIPPKN
jgi:hypothetical protein